MEPTSETPTNHTEETSESVAVTLVNNTNEALELNTSTPTNCTDRGLNQTAEPNANSTDEAYAYLHTDRFTSEKFKVEVRGLPKFYGISVSILFSSDSCHQYIQNISYLLLF